MISIFVNDINYFTAPEGCFATILVSAMSMENVESYADFERKLEETGITNIKRKRIAEYCKGNSVPPFEKARQMLDILKWDMTDKELLDALNKSKEYAKNKPENSRVKGDFVLRTEIRLKASQLSKDAPEQTFIALQERVRYLCGDSGNIKEYVQALIKKDLNEYILTKGKDFKKVEENK